MKYRSIALSVAAALIAATLVTQAQVPGVNSTLQSVFTLAYDNSTSKPTYSATFSAPAASSATDICTLTGSATRTIRVRRIIFTGTTNGGVQTDPIAAVKRSTANTIANGMTMTRVPYSSTFAASTVGTVEFWTTNPTVGTLVGLLADIDYTWPNQSTGIGGPPLIFTFGELGAPVFLRGIAESVSLNLNGLTYSTNRVTCTFEWTEDVDS